MLKLMDLKRNFARIIVVNCQLFYEKRNELAWSGELSCALPISSSCLFSYLFSPAHKSRCHNKYYRFASPPINLSSRWPVRLQIAFNLYKFLFSPLPCYLRQAAVGSAFQRDPVVRVMAKGRWRFMTLLTFTRLDLSFPQHLCYV